uniref:Pre-mRNA-splicing factor SYF2 n=1 Tax=Timema douglasi TaxID=61478 RepID=A0A7R8VNG8_TIMDO|nr:unnamed protein product [Timema douglasi]
MGLNEARQLNHQEVVEEDKRNNLPTNWEARKRKAEWILQDEEKKKEAEDRGENYDRVKLLHVEAVEAERLERKKKKKNPDQGFADYEQATFSSQIVTHVFMLGPASINSTQHFHAVSVFLMLTRFLPTDVLFNSHLIERLFHLDC